MIGLLLSCTRMPVEESGVRFTVTLETDVTKAVADASAATELLVGVLDGDEHELLCKKVTRTAGEAFVFTLPLVKEVDYTLVLFAQAPGRYVADFTSVEQLRSIGLPSTIGWNAEEWDAFVGVEAVSGTAVNQSVLLSHAWAQVNVASTQTVTGVTAVSMTLTDMPTSYDAFTGIATGSQTVTAEGNCLGGTFMTGYNYIGYVYAPVGKDQVLTGVTLSLTRGGGTTPVSVGNMPLRANYRTNILGEI